MKINIIKKPDTINYALAIYRPNNTIDYFVGLDKLPYWNTDLSEARLFTDINDPLLQERFKMCTEAAEKAKQLGKDTREVKIVKVEL